MPRFRFKAIDAAGKAVTGDCVAADLAELAAVLQKQGLFLMEGAPLRPAAAEAETARLPTRADAAPLKTVALFTAQLAIMVRTALPLLESLELLAAQEPDPAFKAVVRDVYRGVREGRSMSAAMARYPKIFDEVYVSLLSAGEASGKMPEMLDRIAGHLQFQIDLAQKVRSALLYPTIVLATSLAVVAFLVLFILPTFLEVFAQFDLVLPLPTRVLVFASELVRRWWALHVAIVVGVWGYLRRWLADPLHTRIVHSLQLRIPYLGPLVRNIVMVRILRTLGSLVEAGVPIIKSLSLAGESAGNLVFRDLLVRVREGVAQGKGLAASLGDDLYVPATVAGMIATGEKTGTIPEVLRKVAAFYEAETDAAIRGLFAVLEPLFVVVLGVLVGGIAVSILLPIFQLSEGFR